MLIIPAIDIKNGRVVRLRQGKDELRVYSQDPAQMAKEWSRQGAQLIHVVDLDGASSGKIKNIQALKNILAVVSTPVEFGGGIRDLETIGALLDLGLHRVVLGTKAVEDRDFLKKAFKKFGGQIIVSIDIQKGCLRTKGWKVAIKRKNPLTFVKFLKNLGFREVIYTDIAKDGTLSGPSIEKIKVWLQESEINVIASGGISILDDIARLKLLTKYGLTGVIIGKALYEKIFTLSEAIKCVA